MNEEIKEVELYSYKVNGKELWTSNLMFAQIRSNQNNSDLYIIKVPIEEKN